MADRIKNYQQEADQITTLKEIRTDLGVTSSSYTPDATVVTKDRVVTFAQAEEELVVLSDIEKGVKQQVTEVDIAQKDIANIKALLQGNLYDYQTDSTSAYTKSVPSGAMPYAGLEQIGGKTVVWNQLNDNSSSTQTKGTVTFTKNNDGSWTVSGEVDARRYMYTGTAVRTIVPGHKYLQHVITDAPDGVNINGSWYNDSTYLSGALSNSIITAPSNATAFSDGLIDVTSSLTGQTVNFNITTVFHDLTLMFGSGNEPSTVEEFESMFPASYYPYNEGTLLSAGVTEVVSKDSNNATLQTIPIPTAIRNLEGYGWSAGSVYNYIDFENKKFIQRVASVDLGTLDYTYHGEYDRMYTTGISTTIKIPPADTYSNLLCPKFIAVNVLDKLDTENGMYVSTMGTLSLYARTYTNPTDFKTAMNGVYLYYELATPKEIDISEYLTDDNLIQVESGGTLTFENQHGDDYQIPVPSEEEYMIDLQEAINNG